MLKNIRPAQLLQRIRAGQTYQAAETWYENQAPRDQAVIKALVVLMLCALFYSWIWVPVTRFPATAENQFKAQMALHQKMKENAWRFKHAAVGDASQSILAIVNSSARNQNIDLKRFEPEGENGLRIWLDDVRFNAAISWLSLLQNQYGIRASQISMDKSASGAVNVRALLVR
ncbi:MAG: type II secretion system protein M [Oceanospirillaceae bacterium]|nr:type II secretion system protein M [Oceanospirillaceae bacterium]MCP5349388.1 type II secretion system protein M [Oceanospirillaceae bacterium]